MKIPLGSWASSGVLLAGLGALPKPALIPLQGGEGTSEWCATRVLTAHADSDTQLLALEDGSILARGAPPTRERYVLELVTDLERVSALRIESLLDDSLPAQGPGRADDGSFALSEAVVELVDPATEASRHVPLRGAFASHATSNGAALSAIDGSLASAWSVVGVRPLECYLTLEFAEEIRSASPVALRLNLVFHTRAGASLGRFRVQAANAPAGLAESSSCGALGTLKLEIQAAMDQGVAFLLSQQELDGAWSTAQLESRNGQTAQCVLALLRCGLSVDHPSVRRGLEFLRARPPEDWNGLASQLLVLELHPAPMEARNLAWATELIRLLENRLGQASEVQDLRLAALGLVAASNMGHKVNPESWTTLARAAMECQESSSVVAGFCQDSNRRSVSANSTAAGVLVLTLAQGSLGIDLQSEHEWSQRWRAGLAWLERNSSMASNVGSSTGDAELYQWLWGLSELAIAGKLTRLGDQDWYKAGARYVVDMQRHDGSWSTVTRGEHQPNTCLVLSFLSRPSNEYPAVTLAAHAPVFGKSDPEKDICLRITAEDAPTVWISSWGTRLLEELEWPGETGQGPRIAAVEYRLPGAMLVGDGRSPGHPAWLSAPRLPPEGWTEPTFQASGWKASDAPFARKKPGATEPRTEWRTDVLWLRREFSLNLDLVSEPALVVAMREEVSAPEGQAASAPRVCLWDEDTAFVDSLDERVGLSAITAQRSDPASGALALRVTPPQRSQAKVPGWGFKITRQPKPGEFRYLRFMWKKTGGSGIMLQLAHAGSWQDRSVRYYAGTNEIGLNPSIQVSRSMPTEWTTIVRDLYEDFGGEAELTGIAFSPMSGEAGLYDSLWLGRTKSDLQDIPEIDASAPGKYSGYVASRIQVWINGSLVHDGGATRGYETVAPPSSVKPLLRQGANVIAVQVDRGSLGQMVDIGISDLALAGRVEWDPALRSFRNPTFATQLEHLYPGKHRMRARASVWVPPSPEELLTGVGSPGTLRWIDAEPLDFEVHASDNPVWLAYAADAGRNLTRTFEPSVRASSQWGEHAPNFALDGRLGSAWISKEGDASPRLMIEFETPVRVARVSLSHPSRWATADGKLSRAHLVEILLNGKGPAVQVEMDPDPLRKSTWELPKTTQLRTLEIKILDRLAPRGTHPPVGLAEVEFLPAE